MNIKRLDRRAEIEQNLCDILDIHIQEGSLDAALNVLYIVKDTFSKYDQYMVKVNEHIRG